MRESRYNRIFLLNAVRTHPSFDAGCRMPVAGCRMSDAGREIQ
jgi:hypothetical protein